VTYPQRLTTPAVGAPLARVDGPLKVTGTARYAADNPVPDFVHAVLVCSTVATGSVDRIDTTTAGRAPGVVRVLTDFTHVTLPYDIRRVSFFGQPVAVGELGEHGAVTEPALVEVEVVAPDRPAGLPSTEGAAGCEWGVSTKRRSHAALAVRSFQAMSCITCRILGKGSYRVQSDVLL